SADETREHDTPQQPKHAWRVTLDAPVVNALVLPLIRSEATDRESDLWILLSEWQGGLPPTR
ncbi:MAG: hypothetical protein CVU63_15925, partial [Deltaproteobacteria bacterium HGW-Deltaproteobacteria-20]